MLTLGQFSEFIRKGSRAAATDSEKPTTRARGFAKPTRGFAKPTVTRGQETGETPVVRTTSFARRLLEVSGFGNAEMFERSQVILGESDAAISYLPPPYLLLP